MPAEMRENERDEAADKHEEKSEYIFKSQLLPVPIPTNLLLHEYVLQHVDEYPDAVAIVDAVDGKEYTYSELRSLSYNVAAGLAKHFNIGKGDVVCVVLPNVPEYLILILGILASGAVFLGGNPFFHPHELEHQIQHSEAKLVITDSLAYPKVKHLSHHLPIVLLNDPNPPQSTFPSTLLFDTDGSSFNTPDVSQDDLAALPFSAGTTGLSKGVLMTHENLLTNISCIVFDTEKAKPGEIVTLGLVPLFHIYGFNAVCCATLRSKGKIVILPRLELGLLLKTLIKYEVTLAYLVPAIFHDLLKNPLVDEYDLSKLKLVTVFNAGAPLALELQKSFEDKFPKVQINRGYGMTEHGCVTLSHCAPTHPRGIAKKGSVGFIVPNLEVKFLDLQTGESVNCNNLGEICVRSKCVTKGYLKNPEATNNAIDAMGWLHTGDVGYIDEDGDVFFVERIKELIKYKGFQVPPAELEAILISHPKIEDAVVVPLPDEIVGEVPIACVVLMQGSSLTKDEVMTFVASKVASYKRVRMVHFIDNIPRSPAGKVLRRIVKENFLKHLEATKIEIPSN